jgi:hypothetical protein
MPTADISRHLSQPAKHYRGARLQQGRPILDSDFNEGADASRNDLRAALLDVVGATGSPDQGFLPDLRRGETVTARLVRFGTVSQAFVLNYSLRAGAMYAGGARWEQSEPEPVAFQREFLQMSAATAPRAAAGEQRHLSYLHGWEQPVTAVEDAEVMEPSLGGADSATRIRRMRRVEVRTVQARDCLAAFAEVLEDLGDGDTATYDPATCELRSRARLHMTFHGEPPGDCAACEPSHEGRYLAGEGHAIRVMLAAPDRYVWAFDNAAPLYRVRLVLDGTGGARVDMLTPPKDIFHHPRQNVVVEFLPWEALLDNVRQQGGVQTARNERTATRVGFFAEADAPYDAATRAFHVRLGAGAPRISAPTAKTNVKGQPPGGKPGQTPAGDDSIALRWDPAHPFQAELNPTENSPDGFVTYVYMRVWHLKDAGAPLTIPITSTAPLGQTGLVPVITGRGRAGDFWTIAVRPESRDEILPREIMREGGSPPHGPRDVVAPISLVTWQSNDGVTHRVVDIDDCRPMVRALTEHDCCTYEVGPGADFELIQDAINALPRSGGHICLREGIYREQIVIAGRSNVLLKGCGARTRIESPVGANRDALVAITLGRDERGIVIRDLTVRGQGQIAIRVSGSGARVELRNLALAATAVDGRDFRSVVEMTGIRDVRLLRSRIDMDGTFSDHAAVYIDCPDRALVEGNTIDTRGDRQSGLSFAWGGLHVAGGSHDIEIRRNRIRGGRGYGITLGSVSFRAVDGTTLGLAGAGRGQSDNESPFRLRGVIRPVVIFGDPDNGGGQREFFPEPLPEIDRCTIVGNVINGAGGGGISSLALQVVHEPQATRAPLCHRRTTFVTSHLVIDGNQIADCARHPVEHGASASAFGGIVLSDPRHVTIRRNRVERIGVDLIEPVCGICVGRGEDIDIVSNHVRGNGGASNFTRFFRGGIVIREPAVGEIQESFERSPRNIHIRRNVVDEPFAPALVVWARGFCRVHGNYLHAERRQQESDGAGITVFAIGRPWEAIDIPLNEPAAERWVQPAGSAQFLNGLAQTFPAGDGATISFAGNTVAMIGAGGSSSEPAMSALLFSTDHTSMVGNRFSAHSPERTPNPNVLVGGATTDASGNRIAETIDATAVSIGALGAMLTACSTNQLTHCPAVFGCANHDNNDYFISEDNLVWFRPPDGRCEAPAAPVMGVLRTLCAFFSRRPGLNTDNFSFIIRNRVQP